MADLKPFGNHKINTLAVKSSVTYVSFLGLIIGVGIGNTVLLNPTISVAQTPTATELNRLFVNPNTGNNKVGNGSTQAPLQTITQALQVARPNTIIILAPGTYSLQTGEIFPLILKPGVSIQGDITNKGKTVKIIGGGEYLSRSFGRQNITVVGANQTTLSGVTLTNTNRRGYGLWIESTNPVIEENTFIGSIQDGVSITGNATPKISKNYFERNGANGITTSGNSRPELRDNILQQTGFGINITQNSAPLVIGNQLTKNRSGILIQANASPVLRNNLIQSSQEDGVVIISQATPNLGSMAEPGKNVFRNNARYDINAKAAKQLIFAGGNNLAANRIVGKVDLKAQKAPIAKNPAPIQEISPGKEIIFTAPSVPKTTNQDSIASLPIQGIPRGRVIILTAPIMPKSSYPTVTLASSSITRQPGKLPPLPSNLETSLEESNSKQFNYVSLQPQVIEFTAPQVSPVPQTTPISTPKKVAPITTGVRYRVVVSAVTDQQQQLVRSLAPDAFPTIWNGRTMMQVGVFSSPNNASEISQLFSNQGLRTMIEQL
ncbi:DUF1565 domain-containing protein [Cronbergia sp. UHCC 0137]|uniref:DUF1565 domain-containing protein n=1 Tax=Cronbergia sp. UHCC 0137 TaxID=3110239 RepID=UPI002B20D3C2|nr:DUF1565 domain-containing protein [Cronbergia sp. UHCC 0137]MEA5621020.1 DUF1565 domain-containing protein [Cronbergia sp. UHCC 0137]